MMLRCAIRRASPTLYECTCAHRSQQRRCKAYERKIDKNNQVYYERASRAARQNHSPTATRQFDFFEMPDLLIDLDAEGVDNGVRSYQDSDEEELAAKWAKLPHKRDVATKLKVLKKQLQESRQKAHDIRASPQNIWRITSHDLVSAALTTTSERRAPALENSLASSASSPSKSNESRLPDTIKKLCRENGIPDQASQDGLRLLQWMLLRQRDLSGARKFTSEQSVYKEEFLDALYQQSTIDGIRRLVTSYLNGIDEAGLPEEFSHQVQAACRNVHAEDMAEKQTSEETLEFIGNLVERLSNRFPTQQVAQLCSFASDLAGHTASTEPVSAWLQRSRRDV